MFEFLTSFRGGGFFVIKILWKGCLYYIVNIYSTCSLRLKCQLWSDLLVCKSKFNGEGWCVRGDFSSVSHQRERKDTNSGSRNYEMRGFLRLIEDCELVDVPCRGKGFNWFKGDKRATTKLDRILLSYVLIDKRGVVGQLIG